MFKTNCNTRYINKHHYNYSYENLPGIITTLWIIIHIIKQTPEVNKDGSGGVGRDQVRLHFLRRGIRRNCDRTLVQTNMVPLAKCLNQSSTLKQRKNPTLYSFFFLESRKQSLGNIKKLWIDQNKQARHQLLT